MGGGRAVAERGRGHQGARQAGRGERPEQAGVVGDLRAGAVGTTYAIAGKDRLLIVQSLCKFLDSLWAL